MKRFRQFTMASVAALTLTALGSLAHAAASNTDEPRIVGGTTAPSVSWGAQVYVNTPDRPFNGFNCSGSIIAADWVLTAHHCLDEDNSGMHVKVGSNDLGQGTEAKVDRKEVSPNGDIALLHLATSVNTEYIKLGDKDPAEGATNQLYGWGRETPTGPPADKLKTADVKVSGSSTDNDGGKAIQSVGVNGAAWKGDSGGPELDNGVQVGVASTVTNQDGTNKQGTNNYGSVAASRDWIKQTAGV
ncbi:S1 family peptidase [Sciscionella sediminilitoris]|uniref:S1 family peptidase n=1 Tax=Sciscionella sediminilitoris TaxID=1445613 RepID=UPI000AF96336